MQKNTYLIDEIGHYSNLLFAWKKFRKSSQKGDIWFDEFEFVKFESNLHENLKKIRDDILNGNYELAELIEIPFPKGPLTLKEGEKLSKEDKEDPCIKVIKEENIALRYRTTYKISIRDQITWIAVINVIGRYFEEQMCDWSYGNRLYRRIWKNEGKWIKGEIRKSDSFMYRKWNQTWPLYKRQIATTIRILGDGGKKKINDNEEERRTIEDNSDFTYFKDEFCLGEEKDELYWISLDIKKFYPNVDISKLEVKLKEVAPEDEQYHHLLKSLLNFNVKDKIEEKVGIPTGLFAAGFLSNVYLIQADKHICDKLSEIIKRKQKERVAQFRYVDDHVIISTDFDFLMKWTTEYIDYLEKEYGLDINSEKLNIKSNSLDDVKRGEVVLDPKYPTPLMTISLQKLSDISKLNLDLLTNREFDIILSDLEQMLIADIPDEEIKRETRISFAITMLSRITVEGNVDWNALYHVRKNLLLKMRECIKKTEEDINREQDKNNIKEERKKEKAYRSIIKALFDEEVEVIDGEK